MESLSGPPHRRKHSCVTSSFSLKNPYDDVLLSNGSGKSKPFEAHEYAEIFSGSSSSIPVLDLSGLDERVGLDDFRSSAKLDYSNIFGGLRNDDVAVPYEELFNGSAKRTKTRPPGCPRSPLPESGTLLASGKTKSSPGEASDQSIDGAKQQFNLSFNKTSQLNSDVTNGKTHIAQLHAVPGFTYFVDQTPRPQKKEGDRPVPSLKRGVSRTWSFSAEVEILKDKGGAHIPDKSHNLNEINLKSHPVKGLPPSGRSSNSSENMDPRQSIPNFTFKEDTSSKTVGEDSPPPLDEDLDENSVAGVSAAALRKAIEQAQESIRIAKMIMERKKEGLQNGSKPRSKGRLKVEDKKETGVGHGSYGSKVNNIRENYDTFDPIFPTSAGINGKLSPSLSSSDKVIKMGKIDMERVWENVEAAREHREPFTSVGKKYVPSQGETHFAEKVELEKQGGNVETVREHREPFTTLGEKFDPSCTQNEVHYFPEDVESKKQGKNVAAVEGHSEAADFCGSAASTERRAVNSVSGQMDKKDLIFAKNNASPREEIEAGKETLEQGEGTFHLKNIPEVVVQLARSTFQKMPTLRKSVTETSEQHQAAVANSQGTENVSELVDWVFNTSQILQHHGKNVDEEGTNMKIIQEDKAIKERENANGKVNHEKKFQGHEEIENLEYARELRSEFNTFLTESHNLMEKAVPEQEKTMKKYEDVPDWKENGHNDEKQCKEQENEIKQTEAHQWFESVEQLEEDLEEQINKRGTEVSPETGGTGTCEPEIDTKKVNDAHDEDGPNLSGEFRQIEEREADTFEYEAAKSLEMEAINHAELKQGEEIQDNEETNDSIGRARTFEQKQDICDFQEAAYERDNDESLDSSGFDAATILSGTQNNDVSTTSSETQEAYNVNRADEYQNALEGFKEKVSGVPETCSGIDKDDGREQLFHLGDIKMPETDSLRRSASEEIFVGSKLHDAFEGLCSDSKKENVGFMDTDHGAELPKGQDAFTADGIHDDIESRQNLPEIHPSDNNTADFELTSVRQMLKQNSESEEESVSTPSLESMDVITDHERHEENADDKTFNMGTVEDDLEFTSGERTCTKEQRDAEHFEEQSEGVDSEEQSEGANSEEQSEWVNYEEQSEGVISEEKGEGVKSEEISQEVKSEEQREGLNCQSHSEPREMVKSVETERFAEKSPKIGETRESTSGTPTTVEKDAKESVNNFDKDDQQQRIEAIKRGREREKDRIAVERAIREARERAFAEARERAERAAVERAAAEARQRAMAEAREKLEKASTASKQVDKASSEAKIRAERAAVERATAEARERAREKAMSQNASSDARAQTDRTTERFSISSRDHVLKHSFSSSDLEKFSEANTESAQRRNLRLERHQRIMERAAKALAEKNMRDLIAQKEQAERNRLAESLDADIKRWATGKEGNLRALLSTLQYILGPDSGWQPISLTEIITTAAVKKAYRKATLYVHPDKLQQRGASIKQKYICEKIFDLLKAAWNRFNSEER